MDAARLFSDTRVHRFSKWFLTCVCAALATVWLGSGWAYTYFYKSFPMAEAFVSAGAGSLDLTWNAFNSKAVLIPG